MSVQFLTNRALQLQEQPPSEQAITDLAQEIGQASMSNEQKQMILGIINTAWANLGREPEASPALPNIQEVLIPPEVEAANGIFASPVAQPQPEVQRQPSQPPQIQQQTTQPSMQQAVTQEPPFENLARIWKAFTNGIQYMVSFIFGYIFCLPAPFSPVISQVQQPLLPERPIQQQPAPVQPQVEGGPQERNVAQPEQREQNIVPVEEQVMEVSATPEQQQAQEGVVYLGGAGVRQYDARVKECVALSFLETFWGLIQKNSSSTAYQNSVDATTNQGISKSTQEGEPLNLFPNIQKGLAYSEHNYLRDLGRMIGNTRHSHGIQSAILEKDGNRHVLIVNGVDREHIIYYHINLELNPVRVHVYNNYASFERHLNEKMPRDEQHPYTMQGYRVQDMEA